MKQTEFVALLRSVGVPVAYNHARKGTAVPYINYTWLDVPALDADNRAYVKKTEVTVQLVADSKEMLTQFADLLEAVLVEVGSWSVVEGYSDDEQIYELNYSMEV